MASRMVVKVTELAGEFLGRRLVGLLGAPHLHALLFLPGKFYFGWCRHVTPQAKGEGLSV